MFEVDFKILNQKSTPAIYADVTAAIPSPGFVGRLFVATDSPYGIFRDTGTAWVLVSGSGGAGSNGVNGLNGTTNIGLGGTLNSNTTIQLVSNNLQFSSNTGNGQFVINSFFTWNFTDIGGRNYNFSTDGIGSIDLDSTNAAGFKSLLKLNGNFLITKFQNINYGLNLDYLNQRFALGDFDLIGGKKNSIQVDDNNSKIYFTTGRSTSNNVPDLLYAENTSSSIRVVKLGDFGNFNNQTSLQVNDGGNIIFTTTTIGNNGIYITNQNAILGAQTGSGYLFINCDYTNNIISTFNTSSVDTGLKLNFNNDIYTFGGFNLGGNIIEINDDPAFNQIKFETSTLIFNGAALEDPTPGAVATKALLITLNGTQYKINLY